MNPAFRWRRQYAPGPGFRLIALKANEIGKWVSSILVAFFAKNGWLGRTHSR